MNKKLLNMFSVWLFSILCFLMSATHFAFAGGEAATENRQAGDDLQSVNYNQDQSVTQRLIQLLGDINALQANFTQQQVAADGYVIRTTAGVMQLQRPGKMRWVSNPPYEQWVIANGDQLWIYDPDLEQVTIYDLAKQQGGSPVLLLTGDPSEIVGNYQISAQDNQFQLTPLDANAAYQTVMIRFENQLPMRIDVTDTLGERTVIDLTEVEADPDLNPKAFEFQIPDGVDVITND